MRHRRQNAVIQVNIKESGSVQFDPYISNGRVHLPSN